MKEAKGDNPGLGLAHRFFERFDRFLKAKERFAREKSESLPSLFCHEPPERIAHVRTFVKSGGSESLKSLFKKSK